MPIEFKVPNLRIQVRERLLEGQSEQIHLQQLLELGEARVHNMAILEHEQQRWKAFVCCSVDNQYCRHSISWTLLTERSINELWFRRIDTKNGCKLIDVQQSSRSLFT